MSAQEPDDVMAEHLVALLGYGRRKARLGAELASTLGCSQREIRALVEHLRRSGHLIGSTSAAGGGYYTIECEAELEDTARHLTSRARHMFATLAAMRRRAGELYGEEQARLFDLEVAR